MIKGIGWFGKVTPVGLLKDYLDYLVESPSPGKVDEGRFE